MMSRQLNLAILTIAFLSAAALAQNGEDQSSITSIRQQPSTYFTTRLDNMTRTLNLSSDQQQKLKPILEQETGELSEIHANPVISEKDKIKKFEEIVKNSDEQLKPILSREQWQKLQTLRKQQEGELRQLAKTKD
jgi:Spy/CpxP family protein refolding chaperone